MIIDLSSQTRRSTAKSRKFNGLLIQVTETHIVFSAYGDRLIQDPQDNWILKILTDDNTTNRDKNETWKALNQRFRLQHIRGCILISHNVFYTPPAGENHQEVTCMASAGTHISPWIVESAYHEHCKLYIFLITYSPKTHFYGSGRPDTHHI
jgi:dolichyl-phosphate-mannose--protein O-mannosyl transferase